MTKEEMIAKREAEYPCLIGSGIPLNTMKHRYVGGGKKYYRRNPGPHFKKNERPGTADGGIADADPRLEAMMQTASKFMPSGWQILNVCAQHDITDEKYMGSGNGVLLRGDGGTTNHFVGLAIDVGIRINDGTLLCNIRNHRSFRTYELLYQLICRLIHGDPAVDGHPGYISYEDGTLCNWGDLVLGKPDTDGIVRIPDHLGARRQFRMEDNGSGVMVAKEFWSDNDNGIQIKDIPGKGLKGQNGFVPITAPAWGVRWGGYFGTTTYHMKRNMGTKEQQMLHTGIGQIITYLPEVGRWDKSPIPMYDQKTGERVKVLATNKKGEVIVPHEYVDAFHPVGNNIGWDSMHYDFRPGDNHSLTKRGAEILCVPAENNSENRDIPVNNKPMSKSAMQNMPLPGTPEDCKIFWEETLGVARPRDFVAKVVPPPIMGPTELTNELYNADAMRNQMEVNARSTSDPTPGGFTDAPLAIVPIVTTSTPSQKSALRTAWERFMRGPGRR